MGYRQITDFSALIAAHAHSIIESPQPLDESNLVACWRTGRDLTVASLSRIDRISRGSSTADNHQDELTSETLTSVLNQSFAAEMLVRTWAAILKARATLQTDLSGTIAQQLLSLQLKTRHQLLKFLVNHADANCPHMAAIDRFRRKAERWTDLLLCELMLRFGVPEFAIDPRRSRNFGIDYFQNQPVAESQLTWRLLSAGLRSSFQNEFADEVRQHDLPGEFVQSILGCLPEDAFHADGPARSIRIVRLNRSALAGDTKPVHGGSLSRPTQLPTPAPADASPSSLSFSNLRRKIR